MRKTRWIALTVSSALAGAGLWACQSTINPPFEGNGTIDGGRTIEGGDAGSDAEGGTPTVSCTAGDGGCNDLSFCTPAALLIDTPSAPPAPLGGALKPGLYAITNYTLYTGANGATGKPGNPWQETFRIGGAQSDAGTDGGDGGETDAGATDAGGTDGGGATDAGPPSYEWQDITNSNGGVEDVNGTITTQGTTLNAAVTCGTAQGFQATYTATATSITMYFAGTSGTATYVFSLMP
jgi:hypothetical protein